MKRNVATGVMFVLMVGGSCAPHTPLPDAGDSPSPPTLDANVLELEIGNIVARYEPPSWRCSQFMFDMQDLAARADARAPEVVDLVERGVYPTEVNFLLYLMRGRSSTVKTALEALARRPDSLISERARAALQAIENGMTRG